MTITPITRVRAAYLRAIDLGSEHDEAVQVVAAALGLPEEAVREAVEREAQEA